VHVEDLKVHVEDLSDGGRRESPAPRAAKLAAVVLFFEIMLVAAVVVITWFALYVLYRLITDES
jgi:hypothetical protein